MKRSCVIGWPIKHSRSPLIHGYWLKSLGIEGSYTKEEVNPKDLSQFLHSLSQRGFMGCNVTVPHKESALEIVHFKDEASRQIGAVNTIWIEHNKLCATNTDAYGFMTYLNKKAPKWRNKDAPIGILGAGGAARAIVYAFLKEGVECIQIFNRSFSRSEELVSHFGSRVKACFWENRKKDAGQCGVLVNATSLGMEGCGDLEIDFNLFRSDAVVSDIVYVPLETDFLKKAKEHNLATVDGLGMLLHQAVPGFEKWFGQRPEVTEDLYQLIVDDIKKQ